jgi:hypothetical protein
LEARAVHEQTLDDEGDEPRKMDESAACFLGAWRLFVRLCE